VEKNKMEDIKTKYLRKFMRKTVFEFLKKTKIKPRHLLIFRIFFALLTIIIIFLGNYFYIVIFLTIYQFVFLLDYVDGALARYRKEFSKKWRRVDRTSHYIISFLFLFALNYFLYTNIPNVPIFIIGTVGSISILLTFSVDAIWLNKFISFEKMKKIHDKRGFFSGFYSFLPIDGPFTLFFFFIIFKLFKIAIIILSLMYFAILIKKIFISLRWLIKKE
jgi:hypothetical protein